MGKQYRNMPSVARIFHYWKGAGFDVHSQCQCWECGSIVYPKPQRAHIIAKCDGGADAEDNLVLVCHMCHVLTDGRTHDEWMKRLSDGIGTITVGGIRIPADFILRCMATENEREISKRTLDLLFDEAN